MCWIFSFKSTQEPSLEEGIKIILVTFSRFILEASLSWQNVLSRLSLDKGQSPVKTDSSPIHPIGVSAPRAWITSLVFLEGTSWTFALRQIITQSCHMFAPRMLNFLLPRKKDILKQTQDFLRFVCLFVLSFR